jgi:fatty-acyl-CoA synthase
MASGGALNHKPSHQKARTMSDKSRLTPIIRGLADIEQIEAVPFSERGLPKSTYEAIQKTAQEYPDEIAIRYIENGDVWKSACDANLADTSIVTRYSELLNNINATANLFRALGVQEEDVVSMVLPNVPEAYFVLWAGEAAGIINPINYLLEAAEIGEIAESAGCKVLVIMGEHEELDVFEKLSSIRAHAPSIEHVLVVGNIPAGTKGCLSYENEIKVYNGHSLDFDRNINAKDIASLFHTGGTTGLPKLAQHSHENEVYAAWALNCTLEYQRGEVTMTGLPIFHCNAAIATGLMGFMVGSTVLLTGIAGYRSPGILPNMFHIVDRYNVVGFSAVPTIYAMLVQLPMDDCDLSSLRVPGCGAAPMPLELFNRFEALTGSRIIEGYGLTEATVVSTICTPNSDRARVGSIGLRLPYTKIKSAIIDADGNYVRDCETDEMGTILVSGPSITPGYTVESKNAELFVTDDKGVEWVNTGDLARQDVDGYFWLTGRSKELIIRGGHNIDPKTIEEVLASHPAVNLAAAIGRPDNYAGEVPVAYVDIVGETNEADLIAYCYEHIGERAAIPKAITIVDRLPVTGVGKIHKPTLHLMELKATVERELKPFSASIETYDINVLADPKLGNKAEINIVCAKGVLKTELYKSLKESFGSYSFSFELFLSEISA